MWYPFKFWRNASYWCIDGMLAEELGTSSPTWKHRRRGRLASRKDPGFLVAVVDQASGPFIEGWCDSPDHRFKSVVLRFEVSDDGYVWTNTRDREQGSMFRVDPGDPPVTIECQSGSMVASAMTIGSRTVDILHAPGLTIANHDLRLAPLESVTAEPA